MTEQTAECELCNQVKPKRVMRYIKIPGRDPNEHWPYACNECRQILKNKPPNNDA